MKIRFLSTIATMSLVFFLASCGAADAPKASSPKINGKFVFDRATTDPIIGNPFVYDSATGRLTELKPFGYFPVLSMDGQMIAVADPENKAIMIFNDLGELVKRVNVMFEAQFFQWDPLDKLYFTASEIKVKKIPDLYHIMSYDLKTGVVETVWTAELNQEIHHLRISQDGRILSFNLFFPANVKGGFDGYLATLNLETRELKNHYPLASPLGWYPDGKSLLFNTNKHKDGQWMNTPNGVLAKLNIETGEFKILHQKEADYQGARLSKDGRSIVYSRAVKDGGKAIFIRSMETFEEKQITQPTRVTNRVFSRDTNPDWFER